MKGSSYQVIKASFSPNGHIFFSYTKLSFQKNLYSFAVHIIILPILIISNGLNLYGANMNAEEGKLIFDAILLLLSIVLTIYSLWDYKVMKRMDGKAYDYKQIKKLNVNEWKRNARLSFQFDDGTKHKLYVKKDECFSQFISNLNFANVRVV